MALHSSIGHRPSQRSSSRSSYRSSTQSSDVESFRLSLTESTVDQTIDCHPASSWNPISSIQSSRYFNYSTEDLETIDRQVEKEDPPDIDEICAALVPWDETPVESIKRSTDSGATEELTSLNSDAEDEDEEQDFEPCEEHYRVPPAEDFPEQQLVRRTDPPDDRHEPAKEKPNDQFNFQLALVPLPAPKSSHEYNGYRHHFITVKEQHRFLILYTFLKRNVNSKVIIYFSTTKSTQYHAKLLNQLKFDVKSAHNGQTKERFLDEYLAFSKQKKGVLCLPDFQGKEFATPPSVSWIVQYEPPGDPTEYIFRVGRISSERSSSGGKALVFLTPHQFGFLNYFKAAHVKFYEYELHKVSNVQRDYEKLVRRDDKLSKLGREAYHSYLMSYASHEYRDVYDVHELEKEMVARSFGFSESPSIANHKDRERESKRPSSREEKQWKPIKKDGGNSWMNKEKLWKHADRHSHLMKKERIGVSNCPQDP